jgi:uncharacterized protein YyaL (SSP411 family)
MRLLEYRDERIHPLRDEKIITSWNGLMIAALAKGGAISGTKDYIELAARAATFILDNLRRGPENRLLRCYMNGASDIPAFLEDYACLTHGMIELFEATLDSFWLNQAINLADEILRLFYDPNSGEFSKTGHDAEQMPTRASLEHDGVLPSPYSLTARCLARLSHAAERPDLLDYAHAIIASSLDDARRHPTAHLGSLQALALLENEPITATFRGERTGRVMGEFLQQLKSAYLPNLVVIYQPDNTGVASVSVCGRGKCYPAASDSVSLAAVLSDLCGKRDISVME